MLIKKKFERLINCGSYENIKVGVEIEHNFDTLKIEPVTKEGLKEIKNAGILLGKIAQAIVKDEVAKIKTEIEEEKSNGK